MDLRLHWPGPLQEWLVTAASQRFAALAGLGPAALQLPEALSAYMSSALVARAAAAAAPPPPPRAAAAAAAAGRAAAGRAAAAAAAADEARAAAAAAQPARAEPAPEAAEQGAVPHQDLAALAGVGSPVGRASPGGDGGSPGSEGSDLAFRCPVCLERLDALYYHPIDDERRAEELLGLAGRVDGGHDGPAACWSIGCGHRVHATCLHSLAHMGPGTCPQCRAPFTALDVDAVRAMESAAEREAQREAERQAAAARDEERAARRAAAEHAALPQPALPGAVDAGAAERGRIRLADWVGRAQDPEWEAIDAVSVLDCIVSPVSHVRTVPEALRTAWACAHVDVFDYIERAGADPATLQRGLKWYLCLHSVLLRGPRRGTRGCGRSAAVIESRFAAWQMGRYAELVRTWQADRARAQQRSRSRSRSRARTDAREESQRERVATALALIEDGQLSRALRMLRSCGVAHVTEGVLAQLRAKYPARTWAMPPQCPVGERRVAVQLTETYRTLRSHAGTAPPPPSLPPLSPPPPPPSPSPPPPSPSPPPPSP